VQQTLSDPTPLSAVEAFVLLKPMSARGRDTIKLAMMTLIAQGTISVNQEERHVLGFTRRSTVLRLRGSRRILFPGARRLIGMVGPGSCTMNEFVARVRRTYGANMTAFVQQEVRPALLRRGLLARRQQRFLLLFMRTHWDLTPAGKSERTRVERAVERAREIPDFLDRDPAQAAAIAFSLGSAVLLVPELKHHYQQLAQAMRDHGGNGGGGGDLYSGGGGSGAGTADPERQPEADLTADFDPLNLADFDADAFDAFDSGLDAFDAGFDGGNGGNGGNGGGNGGC
jgi:hypothetical protein